MLNFHMIRFKLRAQNRRTKTHNDHERNEKKKYGRSKISRDREREKKLYAYLRTHSMQSKD